MSRLLRALDAFWFVEGSATRLAVLRIVIGAVTLAYFTHRFGYFARISGSSSAVFEPVGLATILDAPVPVPLFQAIMAVAVLANVAFIVGWRFTWTGPLFAGLLLWVLCYRNSWSMIYHTDNLMLWQVLILGLTRSADALSLDARSAGALDGPAATLDNRADAESAGATQRAGWSWEYGYPIMLICAVTAVTYVLSGVAKVTGDAGWGWALGNGLRSQIAFDGLRKELIDEGATPLAFALFNNLWLSTVIGIGTLVIELGAPLALLNRRLGWLWAGAAFAMHWGILAIMGIIFWYHLIGVAFLPFVLEEGLVARGRAAAERLVHRLRSPSVAASGEPLAEPG